MEESYFIASVQILFHSQTLIDLDAQLYDFSDNLISTVPLFNGKATSISIQTPLRSFYFRIINTDQEISQLFSYFWPETSIKAQTVKLAQTYQNFIIEIQLNILQQQKPLSCITEPPQEEQKVIDAREWLQQIKQTVFQNLESENFFALESRPKCNFVRKNKHKNLTALLIKNSSNILKKINQNVQSSIAKTYNQLKTAETNETSDEITAEPLPPLDKLKKINSMQDPFTTWKDSDPKFASREQLQWETQAPPQQGQAATGLNSSNKSRLKKSGILLRGKKQYEKKLERETVMDLKNQQATLSIIHCYIAENVPSLNPKMTKENIYRKSRVSAQRRPPS